MLVVATGVSGTGEKQYCERLISYAEVLGKKIKVFNTGDMFIEQAKRLGIRANMDNIFHMDRNTSCALRGGVFVEVLAEVPKLLEQRYSILVNIHGSFFVDDQYSDSIDYHYLSSLNPDFYINFLNNADIVTCNLQSRRQFRDLFKNRDYKYAIERIMEWQTVEILATKIVSSFSKKKFFVVPAGGSQSVLFRLMFEQWRKIFYFGMPLTFLHSDEHKNARQRIDEIAEWLDKYVILIDPRYVEPLKVGQLTAEHENKSVHNQVVGRDCNIMIPQCDGMFGFYPGAVHSYGENYEQSEMYRITGDTFRVFPKNELLSPFFTKWVDGMFQHEDEFKTAFLEYLGKEYLAKVRESEKCYNGGKNA